MGSTVVAARYRATIPDATGFPWTVGGVLVRRVFRCVLLVALLSGCVKISVGGELQDLAVGDTGPGGGIVYYAAPEPFPCGVAADRLCRYLEVAPETGERILPWANRATDDLPVVDARDIALGSGLKNSLYVRLVEDDAGDDAEAETAADYATGYEHGGKDDWFLPSADELNELCKYARGEPSTDVDTMCGMGGALRDGFRAATYWSSTEEGDSSAWLQNFEVGNQVGYRKTGEFVVRPVRGF
jgi:hypothetical protein